MKLSSYIESLLTQAKSLNKTIVLPEGEDERVLEAAHIINDQNIANLIILGNENDIKSHFSAQGWSIDGIKIINPQTSAKREQYADLLFELRQAKGMTKEEALAKVLISNYFGTLMVKAGDADGMVSGANHSTAETVLPALQIIKSARKERIISSLFIMHSQDNKTYYLGDCALNIAPDAKGLCDIALSSADTVMQFGDEARIAMLSYSTYGSGKGEAVDKVVEATKLAKESFKSQEYADLPIKVDGELQADAALDEIVARKKAPASEVAGNANVLIFPNIEAGNIGYKLLQRLGHADMYGPILQGLNAPINDLSRGCSAADIVGMIAITILQTQK